MNKTNIQLRKMYRALFCMFLMGLTVAGCMEHDVYKGGDDNGNDEEPNLFDFSTKSSVTISLDYETGYEVDFEMYYSNPLSLDEDKNYVKTTETKPFIKGKTDAQGKFKIDFADMPDTENEIYVYSPNLTVPVLLHGSLNGTGISITAGASKMTGFTATPTSRAASSGSYYSNWTTRKCTFQKPLGEWNTDGLPACLNNATAYKLTVTDKFTRTIKGTLEKEVPSYSQYMNFNYITISEEANVFVNFVSHNNSERNNALAYYTLAENKEPLDPTYYNYPTANLAIAFPNLRADGLKSGDVVQLKYYDSESKTWSNEFPKGSRIGFALLVDAFKDGDLDGSSVNLMYSDNKYNSYKITTYNSQAKERPQMFAFKADGQLVLSFEDMPWYEGAPYGSKEHGDFSDDIFTVTANPVTALPDVPDGTDPEESEEEEPDFSISSAGILAFEDNWPNKGDYDLNDVVFDYQRTMNLKDEGNFNYRVLSIDEVYTFRNDGATFNNAFGYVIGGNVKRTDVEVSVTSDKQYNGQGLDADLENATVMLVDNCNNVPTGSRFTVKTKFKAGTNYQYSNFGFVPYNPFIVVTKSSGENYLGDNRTEVHLPKNYKPTPKADTNKFGTGADKSVNGNYYITTGNYPFAIEISGSYGTSDIPNFVIPVENKSIEESYPLFTKWVENPAQNQDWWKQK